MQMKHEVKSVFILRLFVVFAVFFLGVNTAFAALVEIELTPRTPGPHEEVMLELRGNIYNTQTSEVYWYVNGEIYSHGIGDVNTKIQTGSVDEEITIDVVVITLEGKRIDLTRSIIPIEVDLIWEADTYTPPFYKGKALPTYKSNVRIVALPNSSRVDPNKLLYTWKENRFYINKEATGNARNVFTIETEIPPTPKHVGVEITSLDGSISATKDTSIIGTEPKVLFYMNNPLIGVQYQNTLRDKYYTADNAFMLRAEPFYFSLNEYRFNKLSYRWVVGGTIVAESTKKELDILLTKPENTPRTSVEFAVENLSKWLQKTDAEIEIYPKK